MIRFPSVAALAICVLARAEELPRTATVEQAVAEAVAHNLDLAAARYDITVAEARRITAALRPNPVVTLSADHLDLLGTGFNTINQAGPPEYAYRTDFVLERGGKRARRIELADNDRALARLNVINQMRSLIFDVENAFVEVQAAKEQLSLEQDSLAALNAIVEINTTRVRAGDLAQVELVRSRVAALQFQTAVEQARLRLTQAKARLQALMGRPLAAPGFEVEGTLRRDAAEPAYETLITQANTHRPDLLALQRSQARSQTDLRLQIAQGKIDYTVGSEYRRQDAFNARGNMLGFFFSVPLPVFNRNQGEIARAQRELDQAGARIKALQFSVAAEVTGAWQQYQSSRKLLETIETSMLEQARDVRKITEYSYRRGEASLLEFLDAQRAFNDAMQSYNEARTSYARSLYLIDSVTAATVPSQVIP